MLNSSQKSLQNGICANHIANLRKIIKDAPKPPFPLCSEKTKIEKKLATEKHLSRFSKEKQFSFIPGNTTQLNQDTLCCPISIFPLHISDI